jgi:mannose-6-phosphate isomerase-like protein (cupin superfamily)
MLLVRGACYNGHMGTNEHATDKSKLLRAGIAEARAREVADGELSVTMFTHGTASIEYYAPRGADRQRPHRQDEIYVVASGTGTFVCGEARTAFEPLDVLFAPAGIVHRFEDFTDDFGTWVLFYGPQGGEPTA